MKKKIKDLILKSQILNQENKDKYLRMLDFFSEEELSSLMEILENEQKGISDIEKKMKSQQLSLNKEYLVELENFYKNEYKKAVQEEEEAEKKQAEDIFKEIDQ